MKFLLVAINAKYIHSNLAVYSLKAFAEKYGNNNNEIEIAEYTINQYSDDILRDIYKRKPDEKQTKSIHDKRIDIWCQVAYIETIAKM